MIAWKPMRLLGLLAAAGVTALTAANCVSVTATPDRTGGAGGGDGTDTGGSSTGGRGTGGEPGTGGDIITVDGGLPPDGGHPGGKATGGRTGGAGGKVATGGVGPTGGGGGGGAGGSRYGVRIQADCENPNSATSTVAVEWRIYNDGPATLDLAHFTLRWWFLSDSIPLEMQTAKMEQIEPAALLPKNPVAVKLVAMTTPVTDADSYMELSFVKPAGDGGALSLDVGPGGSISLLRIRWTTTVNPGINQGNDYSCQKTASGTNAVNKKVTGYVDGALVWGVEPS